MQEIAALLSGPASSGAANPGLELWRDLMAGCWSLLERFDSDGSSHFVARRNDPEAAPRLALTKREQQVIAHIAMGSSLKVIAYELGVGVSTVALDRAHAMRKLGVQSLAELAPLLRAVVPA
jgi:DNA-binding NarL/FixJ family response regulator